MGARMFWRALAGALSMKPMRRNFTSPELEGKLDELTEGALFQITSWDYASLFGSNDVAATRLRNFARSHVCVASYSDGAILFRKKPPLQSDESTA
jgi:hypothetical protein